MGQAERAGGLYYIRGVAVDAEGRAIEDAPERAPNTDVSEQPGSTTAPTQAELIGLAIANALKKDSSKKAENKREPEKKVEVAPVAPAAE